MNICIFSGQGNKNINLKFDVYSDIYFQKVNNILNIPQKDNFKEYLINSNYIFKNQILSLIYNISNFDKLKFYDSEFYNSIDTLIGYSLGEYSALVCAKSISFDECIKLIKFRSELMFNSGLETNSSLITIIGISEYFLNLILKNIKYFIAIYLSPDGFVISINKDDIENLSDKINKLKKINKIYFKVLDVDGGFHTPFMNSSIVKFTNFINKIKFNTPKYNIISNYDGNPYTTIDEIKKKLILHLISPIKWREILNNLEVNKIYELGGNNLKKILELNNIDIEKYYYIG